MGFLGFCLGSFPSPYMSMMTTFCSLGACDFMCTCNPLGACDRDAERTLVLRRVPNCFGPQSPHLKMKKLV